jgi:hypothetical protein
MFADGGWRPASRSARDPTPVDNHVEVELHHEWQVVEENGAVEAERLPNDARCVAQREGDRARPAKSRRGRLSEHLRRYCGLRSRTPGPAPRSEAEPPDYSDNFRSARGGHALNRRWSSASRAGFAIQ